MTRKIIFMDIDGTLFTSKNAISNLTKNYLDELANRGHILYVATGRMFYSAKQVAKMFSSNVEVIASNGALYSVNDQIFEHHLSTDTIKFIIECATKINLPTFLFSQDTVYYTHDLPKYFKQSDKNRIANPNKKAYIHISAKQQIKEDLQILNAISISYSKSPNLIKMAYLLTKCKNLNVSSSSSNNLEILKNGVNKSSAIKQICELYNISLNDAIAFGDGNNDIEMLKTVGTGVAMENGSHKLKQSADFITSSNDENGIYKFLKEEIRL